MSPNGHTGRGINRRKGIARGGMRVESPSLQSTPHSQPSPSSFRLSTPTPEHTAASTDEANQVASPSPLPTPGVDSFTATMSSGALMLPVWGSKDPADELIWIRPMGTAFDPPYVVREITDIVKSNFNTSWLSYGEVRKAVGDNWYKQFRKMYKCVPQHEVLMQKTFHHKASYLLSHHLHKVRVGTERGTWIKSDILPQLQEKWALASWQRRSQKNKQNRSKYEGPAHVGGSIPATEIKKRLRMDPTINPESLSWEVFKKMHLVKSDGLWVNEKAKGYAEDFLKRRTDRDNALEAGAEASTCQSDEVLLLQAVGGMNKKGRIYGLGAEAWNYKSTKISASLSGVSTDEYDHMRDLVTSLSSQNEQLKQKYENTQQQMTVMKKKTDQEMAIMKEKTDREMAIMKEQLAMLMARLGGDVRTSTTTTSALDAQSDDYDDYSDAQLHDDN
ncbi:uncharacterized protein LOC133290993 [Gastrolobium bilobum]|uniref:uncharacterized protein LOC133290993 n=1 Tax=Gastrolobium bilobum TaxID=150636 RepID=UPI002AAF3191|nr:uncharacterized protein LOC133290993 [Gastrolobium bilobum]